MSNDLFITEQQTEDVRKEIAPVIQAAKDMTVADADSYTRALSLAAECDKRAKHVEAVWKESREKAHAAWKSVTETIASFTKPLSEAKGMLTQKAYAWKRVDDERRQIEAAKARREEEKKIEEERLRKAEILAAQGKTEAADLVMEQEIIVAPVKQPEPVKVEGVSHRENWQFEITDAAAIPAEYLMPDKVKIGQIVKAMKGATKIPGIKVFDAGTTVFRA